MLWKSLALNGAVTILNFPASITRTQQYLLIDASYKKFMQEQRFGKANADLKHHGWFDRVARIRKVYLHQKLLYKEHLVQRYISNSGNIKNNPDFDDSDPTKETFTISVGNGLQEEVVKYGMFNGQLLFGPCNPHLDGLLQRTDMGYPHSCYPKVSTAVNEFLAIAHFLLEKPTKPRATLFIEVL